MISIIVLFGFIVCFYLQCYCGINNQYPKSEYIVSKIGEEITHGDIIIKGISYECLTYTELKNNFGDSIDYSEYETNYDTDDLIFINVKVLISNIGENNVSIPLYNATISSKTYSNGIDASTFSAMNEGLDKLVPILEVGESTEICFTYTMFKSVLYKNNVAPQLELILQLYPKRISICLD